MIWLKIKCIRRFVFPFPCTHFLEVFFLIKTFVVDVSRTPKIIFPTRSNPTAILYQGTYRTLRFFWQFILLISRQPYIENKDVSKEQHNAVYFVAIILFILKRSNNNNGAIVPLTFIDIPVLSRNETALLLQWRLIKEVYICIM